LYKEVELTIQDLSITIDRKLNKIQRTTNDIKTYVLQLLKDNIKNDKNKQ